MDSILPILVLVSLFHLSLSEDTKEYYGPNTGDIFEENYKHPNAVIRVGNPPQEINIAKYYTYNELEELLKGLSKKYNETLQVFSLGESYYTNKIWAVQITRNVTRKNVVRPMFKFVANVHGDEMVGYALLTSLIQYLLHSDKHDPRITSMLDNIDIWIVPTVNPDGMSLPSLYDKNGKNVDLDMDFPHNNYLKKKGRKKHVKTDRFVRQPETEIMMNFIKNHPFVLSGNLKGGALVASYPWDYPPHRKSFLYYYSESGETPHDEIFQKLALDYAQKNWMMAPGNACGLNFPNGISNGYKWGEKKPGGMQDFNYEFSNCLELSFYLGCVKQPLDKHLPFYWDANLESMLSFIEKTRTGVYGTVKSDLRDGDDEPIKDAVVVIKTFEEIEVDQNRVYKGESIKVTKKGAYWRLLSYGNYELTASARGFYSQTVYVNLTDTKPLAFQKFVLTKITSCFDIFS